MALGIISSRMKDKSKADKIKMALDLISTIFFIIVIVLYALPYNMGVQAGYQACLDSLVDVPNNNFTLINLSLLNLSVSGGFR
jgi:hypothetical protein